MLSSIWDKIYSFFYYLIGVLSSIFNNFFPQTEPDPYRTKTELLESKRVSFDSKKYENIEALQRLYRVYPFLKLQDIRELSGYNPTKLDDAVEIIGLNKGNFHECTEDNFIARFIKILKIYEQCSNVPNRIVKWENIKIARSILVAAFTIAEHKEWSIENLINRILEAIKPLNNDNSRNNGLTFSFKKYRIIKETQVFPNITFAKDGKYYGAQNPDTINKKRSNMRLLTNS